MSGDAPSQKGALRRTLLRLRRELDDARRQEASQAISQALFSALLARGVGRVMIYAPVKGEVDLTRFAESMWAEGAEVVFPVTQPETRRIVPKIAPHLRALRPGAYGIPEPTRECATVSPADLDAVVVPALAYDRRGFRVGYGGGYYDRFLQLLPGGVLKVGVVYAELLLQFLPHECHDQRVDWVITDMECVGPL